MKIKETINIEGFEVGVIIARFQVDELHVGHKDLLEYISSKHKKIILFLGDANAKNTRKNPLDFATRKMMVQTDFPNIIILPLTDQRCNTKWSKALDDLIVIPFGAKKTLIYGSRDSFIPSYNGKFKTIELSPTKDYNSTNIRGEVAKEIINTRDFRAGIIHSIYSRYPITYPTVDICAYNNKGQFLMAKKPNEGLWRFVGGFVDRNDDNYEISAEREFREETGGSCNVGKMKYILSQKVDDWRYRKEADGIMTTLFLTEYNFGMAKASDDIVDLEWVDIKQFTNYDGVRTKVIPEHRDMMLNLINKIYSENLIPNLGDRLVERTDNITYTIE